jgi:hypothetical protein
MVIFRKIDLFTHAYFILIHLTKRTEQNLVGSVLLIFLSFLCCIFCFVHLCPVFCVPNVASFSEMPILYCPFSFL